MAQPNSIQREPTMEEILASIRRIIEDSEPGATKPQEDEVSAEAAPERAASEGAVIEVEAFREGLGRGEAEQPAPAAAEAPEVRAEARPSMADIQASLREVDEDTAQATPEATAPQPAARAEAPAAPTSAPMAAAPSFDTGPAEPSPAEPAADQARGELRPSIISEQAGRQVAAAFGELSEVFAASRRRSFDEMAEEMIRPMLREWMDNNLPVLVERLVREEIERVARGA